MTLAELRARVEAEKLDGRTVRCGHEQWTQWITKMNAEDRFAPPPDPTPEANFQETTFPSLYSSYEHPRVLIVLDPDMHPTDSRVE